MQEETTERGRKWSTNNRRFNNFWSNVSAIKVGSRATPSIVEEMVKATTFYH